MKDSNPIAGKGFRLTINYLVASVVTGEKVDPTRLRKNPIFRRLIVSNHEYR
jgi:hypothetical protein